MKTEGSRRLDRTDLISTLRTLGLVLTAIVLALLIGAIFVSFVGKNPLEAYYYMIVRPYTTKLGFGEIITKAIPLIIVGVGVAFAAVGGCNNLGGEGQMYVGTLGAILVATSSFGQSLGAFSILFGLLAGALFGAIWGGFAGFMKAYYGSNELIVTIMLNYVALQLIAYLVHGPIMEQGGVNPQSAEVPAVARLPKLISGTRAHVGLFIALACVAVYWFVCRYTQFGYNLRVVGKSPKAAQYAGCNVKKYRFLAMVLAGGFAGLAGAVEIYGVQYRLIEGICEGMGITGMVVALIGCLNPLGLVAASVMMAGLDAGAEKMQISSGVPVTLVDILQGIIVLFILISFSLKVVGARQKKRGGKKA